MARTRRGDGFATTGSVNQSGGDLPIYLCNSCGREVVWATSTRTGGKYLVNVSTGRSGARYYVGRDLHDCAAPFGRKAYQPCEEGT